MGYYVIDWFSALSKIGYLVYDIALQVKKVPVLGREWWVEKGFNLVLSWENDRWKVLIEVKMKDLEAISTQFGF